MWQNTRLGLLLSLPTQTYIVTVASEKQRFGQEKDLFNFSKNTDVLHENSLYESALLTQPWKH